MVVVGTGMKIAMSTKKFFERVLKVAIAVVELLCAGGPCSVGRRYFGCWRFVFGGRLW